MNIAKTKTTTCSTNGNAMGTLIRELAAFTQPGVMIKQIYTLT